MTIDYYNMVLFDYSHLPGWVGEEVAAILTWGKEELRNGTFPRGDYREFLELGVVCLGGTVENFKFKFPGADHHARWMSKGI